MQVGVDGKKLYSGMIDAITKIARTEGVGGLYKGLVPNLIGIVPEKVCRLRCTSLRCQAMAPPTPHMS